MIRDLVVGEQARKDLQELADVHRSRWSRDRHEAYLNAIAQKVLMVRRHPERGRPPVGGRPLWSVRSGRHLIFYQVFDDRIEVVRVLHERRNIDRLLARTRRT